MLVITRKPQEKVIIGEGKNRIEVVVISVVNGGNVRLGIDAPKEISIHREEIYHRIHGDKE